MGAISIDSHTLNNLFDNQKKLDELFDSIFDDGNIFFIDSSSPQIVISQSKVDIGSQYSCESDNTKRLGLLLALNRNTLFYALPVALEIAIFYLVLSYLL